MFVHSNETLLSTHIITCSLTPAKIREFKHMKVVRPEWLVESVKAGVLLRWKDFIYTPGGRTDVSQGKQIVQKSLQSFATGFKRRAIDNVDDESIVEALTKAPNKAGTTDSFPSEPPRN